MTFGSPLLLLLLLLVPAAAAGWLWLEGRRERRVARWSSPALLPNMAERPSPLKRLLPTALLLVGVALLLVGFARPRTHVRVSDQNATLVLVVDESGSMLANDAPPTRLGRAKQIADRFLQSLPRGYRAALVVFSDHSAVLAPPTRDRTRVQALVAGLRAGPQGTALADAVAHAVQVARSVRGQAKGKRPPATIVLLSDGGQTAGRLTPPQAGLLARHFGIPVVAVALGTPNGVVVQQLKGGYKEQIDVPVEPQSLQQIARTSGGRTFTGTSVDVRATLAGLGSRIGHHRKLVDVAALAAAGGLVFMLAGGVLSGVWFRRLV
ncbi:MAG TPA: VWA domain-containing protein [Gaiellaceae bacterium]|nr:VWA domain-containing protein [Gaiellaceae bacterium]